MTNFKANFTNAQNAAIQTAAVAAADSSFDSHGYKVPASVA